MTLDPNNNETGGITMSQSGFIDDGEEFVNELLHYGVKGMKWGVRKDDSVGGTKTKERGAIRRGLTKWNEADNAGGRVLNDSTNRLKAVALPAETRDAIQADMGSYMLGAALGMRKDPRFSGKDLKTNPALKAEYRQEMERLAQNYYSKRLTEEYTLLGLEAARYTTRAAIDYNNKRLEVKATKAKAAQHADDDLTVAYELEFDDKGFVVGMKASDSSLAHYGVKGMKWGVRKDGKSGSARGKDVVVTQKKGGTFAKTKGGKGHALDEDAKNSLVARQKARASTTDALSNKELRTAIERMQLEQQFKRLEFESDRRSKGARFIAGLLGQKRYNGEKLKYKDMYEEWGGSVRETYQERRA